MRDGARIVIVAALLSAAATAAATASWVSRRTEVPPGPALAAGERAALVALAVDDTNELIVAAYGRLPGG